MLEKFLKILKKIWKRSRELTIMKLENNNI